MKLKLIAIAAIALSPAVVFGQTRTHIRVTKDGSHATQSTGDVTTTPAPAAEPAPAPAPEPTPAPEAAPAPAPEPTPAPTITTDSATTTTTTDSSSMKMDSTATPADTVKVPRSNLNVSPIDSVKMGIPSTRETERADSTRAAKTP